MTVTTTSRSEQRMTALAKADDTRIRRAQLKRDINTGTINAADIITTPPVWAGTMRVTQVLRSVRGIGDTKTVRLMERCGVSATATLASLTVRQRHCLAPLIGPGGDGWRGHPGPSRPSLSLANRTRTERNRLRVGVAMLPPDRALERLAGLLEDPPASVGSVKVVELLAWAHRVGAGRALRFMRAARVTSMRTVGQLTPRQRSALAACLRGDTAAVLEEAEFREWAARVAA